MNVLVVGNGPAGALTAAYLASQWNCRVRVVAPTSSHCTYCTWVEALEGTWLKEAFPGELFTHRWPSVEVKGVGTTTTLNRAYGMVNWNPMHEWAMALPGVTWTKTRIAKVYQTHAVDESGVRYFADRIIDASGHDSTLTRYEQNHIVKRYQSFYGERIRCDHGIATAQLMNWELAFRDGGPPSFVYVLPLSDHSIFLEETVLISEAPVSHALLKERLQQRKQSLGIASTAPVEFHEAYDLPMGGPLPRLGGSIGGAAAMVHPATGYMFTYMVDRIPAVVADDRVHARSDRILRRLNDLGGFVLCQLTTNDANDEFFQSMFQTPWWFEFLTRKISVPRYVWNMLVMAWVYPGRRQLLIGLLRYADPRPPRKKASAPSASRR